MKLSPLDIHLGPGLVDGRLDGILEQLGLHPVRLRPNSEPAAQGLYLVGASTISSQEQLASLAKGGAVVVLHDDDEDPPAGWDSDAVWVPVSAPTRVLSAALRMARENVALKMRATRLRDRLTETNRIGIALSAERNIDKLQDLILQSCRQLTSSDAATLYLVEGDNDGQRSLRFAWSQNASVDIPFSTFTMPLGEKSVGGYTIISGRPQVVDDVYDIPDGVPFAFNRSIDEKYGYRTKSVLCVPMRNHDGEIVGAIQLINAKRRFETELTPENVMDEVVPFEDEHLELIQSIASQAAVALDNRALIDSIQALFEGFVKASVTAIESRDPTTYGHSGRVAALTVGLAQATTGIAAGAFKDVRFDSEQIREIRYASLLHDFGKVGVRENVLVKEKKLYGANMDLLKARFAFVERSLQQRFTERKLQLAMKHGGDIDPEDFARLEAQEVQEVAQLKGWLEAVYSANEPSVLPEDKASTLSFLAEYMYEDLDHTRRPLLEPDEFHFLSIRKGTLDEAERHEIESHVSWSFKFLINIPWTPQMRNIPQIAYAHHEKLDGTGYPRALTAAEIPVQARMMTISDIYDALTAQDRPYKRALPYDRALDILGMEAKDGKIDRGLLDVFIERRVYELAAAYRPEQGLLMGSSTLGAKR